MANHDTIHKITTSSTYPKSTLSTSPPPTPIITSLLKTLHLEPHPEGGFFHQTDRATHLVPNPFLNDAPLPNASGDNPVNGDNKYRNASTTIHYYLTPGSPVGHFHRNRARTVHTLHWGRGRYVVIHPSDTDGNGGEGSTTARVETFVVGTDVQRGEVTQWIVEGDRFKTSFLLEDEDTPMNEEGEKKGGSERGLLISETVVPGFEFCDHDFMTAEQMRECIGVDGMEDLGWLLNRGEREKLGLE